MSRRRASLCRRGSRFHLCLHRDQQRRNRLDHKIRIITSATQQVTGIDVSSLSDGILTYSVTLTDAAGNVGTAATVTATLDRTIPAGYSITANSDFLNASQATSTGFTFAGSDRRRYL